MLNFAKPFSERNLGFVRACLPTENQNGVFVHAVVDILHILVRNRLGQVNACNLTGETWTDLLD